MRILTTTALMALFLSACSGDFSSRSDFSSKDSRFQGFGAGLNAGRVSGQ